MRASVTKVSHHSLHSLSGEIKVLFLVFSLTIETSLLSNISCIRLAFSLLKSIVFSSLDFVGSCSETDSSLVSTLFFFFSLSTYLGSVLSGSNIIVYLFESDSLPLSVARSSIVTYLIDSVYIFVIGVISYDSLATSGFFNRLLNVTAFN